MRVVCAYAKRDQRACTVTHDGVPLFVAVGQDMFTYGPLGGPRLLRGGWYVANLDARDDPGTSVGWGFYDPGNPRTRIALDLRSMVKAADRDRAIRQLGENRFLLTGQTNDGGRLEAEVDTSSWARFVHLTARSRDGLVAFEVERLVVNGPIRPEFFRFPRFQERLNLTPATSVHLDNLGEPLQQVMVSSLLRVPLKKPAGPKEWESNLARPPNWDRWEAQDAVLAPMLKEIVKDMRP